MSSEEFPEKGETWRVGFRFTLFFLPNFFVYTSVTRGRLLKSQRKVT